MLVSKSRYSGTNDNNNMKNKNAAMLYYRSKDATEAINFFNFMTVIIIIPYILCNVPSELSALTISFCTA